MTETYKKYEIITVFLLQSLLEEFELLETFDCIDKELLIAK